MTKSLKMRFSEPLSSLEGSLLCLSGRKGLLVQHWYDVDLTKSKNQVGAQPNCVASQIVRPHPHTAASGVLASVQS